MPVSTDAHMSLSNYNAGFICIGIIEFFNAQDAKLFLAAQTR
jgi:hypothetical protein